MLATIALCCLLLICPLDDPASACTSFCLDTSEGPYFATNLDLCIGEGLVFVNRRGIAKEGYRESITGETAKWTSKYGSVTFSIVGCEYAWGGMNEAGLVVSTMQLLSTVFAKPDERPALDVGSWVQYVLDTCSNVQEAIQVNSDVRLFDPNGPSHFLIADEAGECAVIECLEGQFVCYTGEDLPVKALANATYADGLSYIRWGDVPELNPGASVERVAAAAEMSQSFRTESGISPVDYSLSVLTDIVVAPKKWWSDWFHEPYTRWSIVFDIAERQVYYRTLASPQVKYLSLSNLDFSCEAPLLMLDVNAELEGNVEASFTPYGHDANLKVFRGFCDKWGIDVSKEAAVELMRFFESFECVQ